MKRVRELPTADRLASGSRTWARAFMPAAFMLSASMVLAACSAITVPEEVETAPAPATSAATTAVPTDAPTSTVVAVPSATTAAATQTTTATEPVPTTIAEPLYRAPLTGLPTAVEITRPAAVVKIDNHPKALPQWGINAADVVYEELVEGGLTRLAAVFHSRNADVVGPIRSARTGDFALLSNLNRPIFVNSGANDYTMRALGRVDAVNITDGGSLDNGVFERSSAKNAPHNLISDTARIFAAGGERGGTPPAHFRFRNEGETLPPATRVSGVDINFGQIEASYRWDDGRSGWARTQNGQQHTDFDGVRVAPENVVVQFVQYRQSPANRATPEPVLTGSGTAWMFTDGHVIEGTWERLSERDTTVFRSNNAVIVPFTRGRTWVALAREGTATIIR